MKTLVEKLEFRLRDMETRMQDEKEKGANEKKELKEMVKAMEVRLGAKNTEMEAKNKEMEARLEAKDKEMETRLQELEDKMRKEKDELEKKERQLEASISEMRKEKDELEKRERRLEASVSKLRSEMEESLRKEMTSNYSKNALTNPSPRDLPIVIISAWRATPIESPQTVTFESFLANFDNADRPGGGSGELDLDSGIFTCFTSGYYTVSFSAGTASLGEYVLLYLHKNGEKLPESQWFFNGKDIGTYGWTATTSSRILVSNLL